MFVKDLETLKYSELQKLAKGVGIKANQKIDKLVKALKDYYIEHDDDDKQTEQEKMSDSKKVGQPWDKAKKGVMDTNQSPAMGRKDSCRLEAQNSPRIMSPLSRKVNAHAIAGKGTPTKQSDINNAAAAKYPPSETENTTPDNKTNRKRRRTFELDEPTLSAQNTPSSDDQPVRKMTRQRTSDTKTSTGTKTTEEPTAKRVRKDTYCKNSPSENNSGSPGTKAMIDSIDPNLSSAERKAGLMSALDKKVQSKASSSPAANTANQPSQIPRFMAFLANKKKTENQKPVTPGNKDWTKIHEKEFSKFDSLDVYLVKKQQRMEKLTASGKKVPALKSPGLKPKIVKPVARPQSQVKPFVPTVTSTKNLSFNFSKTPASQTASTSASTTSNVSKTPRTQSNVASARKSVGISQRTTPFKFTGNNTSLNTTVNSQKKTFDLKASLAKPLTWKPHTGKLQPLDFNKPPPSSTQKPSVQTARVSRPSRQAMASKTRPLQAKDVRRAKQLDRRNNQKYIDMMKRRGLMA